MNGTGGNNGTGWTIPNWLRCVLVLAGIVVVFLEILIPPEPRWVSIFAAGLMMHLIAPDKWPPWKGS